ncbi:MAG: hypothetical protein AAFZ15_17620 [Bacteroidota bacterium]
MKNLLIGTITLLMFSINLTAQDYGKPKRIFQKGQTDIQIGYGLLTTAVILDNATTNIPSLTIRGDRFFSDNFSLGVAYTVSSHTGQPYLIPDGLPQRIKNTTHQVVVRPTFHMTNIKNLDLYGGFNLGLNFEMFSVDRGNADYVTEHLGFQSQRTKGVYTAFVGGRYVIDKRWSAFGEVGYSTSLFSFGVGYRI